MPVSISVLMGGEQTEDWDIYPERQQILIGTQDMLLSRALSRGYAASRARWPVQFGMLSNDCLWIFDEIQLMGFGLATTARLEALRCILPANAAGNARTGHKCVSVWMSTIVEREWLSTVDFRDRVSSLPALTCDYDEESKGLDEKARRVLDALLFAKKSFS